MAPRLCGIELHEDVALALALLLPVSTQAQSAGNGLTNLIDNACRYGDTVSVAAERSDHTITITIDDDGPGIPEEQREEAFQPFVRLDSSRDPNRGGGGLGLTIALDVARSHGGDLVLSESPAGGLRAQVLLPV